MKVLVVEDEFVNRLFLQKLLSKYGQCDIAGDGLEALDAFKSAWQDKSPYDLICMDIMMPNMDGREATKLIRELEQEMGLDPSKEVPIFMTTALDDVKIVMNILKEGATSYFIKPIEKKKLLEEIKKVGLLRGVDTD